MILNCSLCIIYNMNSCMRYIQETKYLLLAADANQDFLPVTMLNKGELVI